MKFAPLILGFVTVGQGVLNRWIAERWGLSAAIVLSALTLLLFSSLVLALVRLSPGSFPAYFAPPQSLPAPAWWFVLPGLLGCVFISGIPWAISRLGAAHVFVMVIAGQIVASLIWDAVVEGRPVTLVRLSGASLAVLGAALLASGD